MRCVYEETLATFGCVYEENTCRLGLRDGGHLDIRYKLQTQATYR